MNPASAIHLDDTHWPLLIVTCEGSPSLEQYRDFFAQRSRFLERGESHVGITDALRLKLPPPGYREMQTEWLAHNGPLLARTLLGVATLVRTPDIVLYKSTSNYRSAVPYPTVNVADLRSGVAWAAQRFQAEGMGPVATRLRAAFSLDASPPS